MQRHSNLLQNPGGKRNTVVPLLGLVLFFLAGCSSDEPLFRSLKPAQTGIDFANTITETPQLNILNYEYLYNGGGVGIGDFNNDSLPDIYFTGNLVNNALYLNKGGWSFENITEASGTGSRGKWCKGVSVVDINADGWQDIYVCAAILPDSNQRRNMLFVNQGAAGLKADASGKKSIPQFTESAAAYGLDDPSHTQMAAFFDYDNDGDLDVYLMVNELNATYPNEFRPIRTDGSWPNTDKLLRQDFDAVKGHGVFTDVSKAAGIQVEGYGLGLAIADINQDGFKDIYVSNDYLSNNLLYINNGNGSFTERCAQYFKHSSKNAMGNDIADINNDGLADLVETDMSPADNYRLKMMNSDISYQNFQYAARFGYMQQYPRNMLQLNQGLYQGSKDSAPKTLFSETAYFSGMAQTDWSWAPLLADADNDGWRDLFVSNGLPKDMSDLDFMAYRRNAYNVAPLQEVLNQLPTVHVSNYAFRNQGNAVFENQTKAWGWDFPTYSAGMAYADLDRDGDLDFVVNNTNEPASILENRAAQIKDNKNHFVQIALKGDVGNPQALGALIEIYHGGQKQVWENSPYRGYLSTVQGLAHFGLGTATQLDSIRIVWPNQKKQVFAARGVDRLWTLAYDSTAVQPHVFPADQVKPGPWQEYSAALGLDLLADEDDFIDFNGQKLLPRKLSQSGPALAVGDLNGDGLADLVMGGAAPIGATLAFQTPTGKFLTQALEPQKEYQAADDAGLALLDADADGDLDLYVAAGGGHLTAGSPGYQDRLYLNNGKGSFQLSEGALPALTQQKSVVRSVDFDGDGDLDLFVGGRAIPGQYPAPASSVLLRNDGQKNKARFTDVTQSLAPALQKLGLVTDGAWTQGSRSTPPELVVTLEWGNVKTFAWIQGKYQVKTDGPSLPNGWWNAVLPADLDGDGDTDLVLGNMGENLFIRPSETYPFRIYAKDFDGNGSYDAVPTLFLPAQLNGPMKEFPLAGRDEFIREMTVMKNRFPNYASYAQAAWPDFFAAKDRENELALSATEFRSGWWENKGKEPGLFHPFPAPAQWFPLYAFLFKDMDGDGKKDLVLNGNEMGMAPYLGRADAGNGLVLLNKGKGNFLPWTAAASGFYVPGNGKALATITVGKTEMVVAAQNKGRLKVFARDKP